MIEIRINGEPLSVPKGASLQQALREYLNDEQQQLSFAVALNSDFVGKSDYESTQLQANDSIDVLFPIFGG